MDYYSGHLLFWLVPYFPWLLFFLDEQTVNDSYSNKVIICFLPKAIYKRLSIIPSTPSQKPWKDHLKYITQIYCS